MIIRSETTADHAAIRAINLAAFADQPYSHQTEHLIVEALRDAGALELSLVAEENGEVVGHIAFSRVTIGGAECGWYLLGPVAVLPAWQGGGVGGRLVRAGLDELRRRAARGCVLVGQPAYYERFGFRHEPALRYPGVPPEYLLCLPLAEGMPRGEVAHHPAFDVGAA
jgi:putative acetyltransferase